MSFIAFITDRFDESVHFYGEVLGFSTVAQWDRADSRGIRFDLCGMKLELLDNRREKKPLQLGTVSERVQVVVEVEDLINVRSRIPLETPEPQSTSWGARLFQLRDPDGVPVTFLEWLKKDTL